MSTPRFTLGPWEVALFGDGRFGIYADGYRVATVHDFNGRPANHGNAHLIAAAPTLFGIVRQYMASDERQGFTGTILYEQAKAAIDAATGEKS